MKKKIAIIGSGISGSTAAYKLKDKYEIHVYEKNKYLGGHTHTHEIKEDKKKYFIDSGFIVFNTKTYPNFIKLLQELKIKSANTNMSFSVNYPGEDFEWSGKNIDSFFFKNKKFFSVKFFKIIFGILKFNYLAKRIDHKAKDLTIDDFLRKYNFTEEFKKYYFFPMCASIWSNPINKIKNYKTSFLIQFFINHGLINLIFRPQWKIVSLGSKKYIDKIKSFSNIKFYLNNEIKNIKIINNKIILNNIKKYYDYLIFANHTDEIIKILPKKFKKQKNILSFVKYQTNEACLHCDENLMPKNKFNWSSWNFIKDKNETTKLTYWMNYLQNLKSKKNYFVSINSNKKIDKKKILKKMTYKHPVFKYSKEHTFKEIEKIQGQNNIYYCGAWTGYGFHEDGVVSAKNLLKYLL